MSFEERRTPNWGVEKKPRCLCVLLDASLRTGDRGLDRAIKLNPEDAIAYGDRALAWIKWGDYDQAIADRNEAIKLAPGIPRDSSPDL